MEHTSKTCTACGENKPLFEFNPSPNGRTPDKHARCCRMCWNSMTVQQQRALMAREQRKNNIEKSRERTYSQSIKRRLGMTLDHYNAMFEAQEGKCAICGSDGGERRLSIDHCHKSGRVRALLCAPCNQALGFFKDDAGIIRKAAQYIDDHNGASIVAEPAKKQEKLKSGAKAGKP